LPPWVTGTRVSRCRDGVAKGQCIRVSPALYATEDEVDHFVTALAADTGKG